ncbi:hypothetical protein [Halopiger djelfimassiliensis]|uniref:hypothetical protein n=1 Tax=Halopiger djelfimassiliensis TaxID=1293047 RepID=UPI000A4E9648|nr:hypothetical protein [Halopiger djelfimassiliensis]
MDGPAKWAGFVFITGGVGLLLYLSEKDSEVADVDEADPFSLPGSTPNDHQKRDRDSDG